MLVRKYNDTKIQMQSIAVAVIVIKRADRNGLPGTIILEQHWWKFPSQFSLLFRLNKAPRRVLMGSWKDGEREQIFVATEIF